MEAPIEMQTDAVPAAPRPRIGLEGMNEGYDQPADPPSYSQVTKVAAQPGFPEPPPVLGAYPGVAPQVAVTQQPVYTNTVVVQGIPPPVPDQYQSSDDHNHYMAWSMCSCLCCFCPLGIFAIVFSSMSQEHAISGRMNQARRYARVAVGLNVASILAGIVCYIIVVLYIMVWRIKDKND